MPKVTSKYPTILWNCWLLYLLRKRSMTFVFKTLGAVLTGSLNYPLSSVLSPDNYLKRHLSVHGERWKQHPLAMQVNSAGHQCHRILETLKNDKYDPKASSSSPEVLCWSSFSRQDADSKAAMFLSKIFSGLMAYHWACPKGMEYRWMT